MREKYDKEYGSGPDDYSDSESSEDEGEDKGGDGDDEGGGGNARGGGGDGDGDGDADGDGGGGGAEAMDYEDGHFMDPMGDDAPGVDGTVEFDLTLDSTTDEDEEGDGGMGAEAGGV